MRIAPFLILQNSTTLAGTIRQQKIVLGISAALLLTFSIAKSLLIEFTIDEIQSWQEFGSDLVFYPKTYHVLSANNHWLNSCLMHYSAGLFGESEFALRLPNLLAHAFYLLFTAKVVLLCERKTLTAFCIFVLLNAHPYLLDFFSLARGYGLAIAAMSAGLYYSCRFLAGDRSFKNLIGIITSGILAVLSNFILLDYLIPLLLLLSSSIVAYNADIKQRIKQLAILVFPFILLLIAILPHIFNMQKANALYYGSESLWEGTVKTLCIQLMYEAPYGGNNFFTTLKPVIYFIAAFIFLASITGIRQQSFKKWMHSPAGFFVLVFIGTIMTLIIQHLLVHSLYPYQRTGLFLFILMLFAFIFSLEYFVLKRPAAVLIQLLSIVVAGHFAYNANLSYALEWKSAGGTKQFLNKIVDRRNKKPNPPSSVTVSAGGISGASLLYLIKKENMEWLKVNITWQTALLPADYYLVEGNERAGTNVYDWIKADSCEANGNSLYVDPAFIAR